MEEVVTLNEICRVCLLKTEGMKLLDPCNEQHIIEKLNNICSFQLEINETLPQYLCWICEEKLNIAYEFQQLCNKSQQFILACIAATDTTQEPFETQNLIEKETCNSFEQELISECQDTTSEDITDVIENPVCKEKHFFHDSKETEKNRSEFKFCPIELETKSRNDQVVKLAQYATEDVNKIIQKFKAKFLIKRHCLICGFVANDSRALSVHMTRIHRDKKMKWCTWCNNFFEDIDDHITTCHEDEFKCPLCGKCCTNTGHFMEHLARHSNDKKYVCSLCNKSFVSNRHLKTHTENHHTEAKSYNCNYCEKSFLLEKYLKRHLKTHAEKTAEDVANDINEDCCESEDTGKQVQTVEGPEESKSEKKTGPQNFCQKCDKKVRSLAEHMKRHHGNFPVKKTLDLCMFCGKQFKSKSKLSIHLQIHTGEFRYKCSYCDAKIPTRSRLIVHERIHTGEKPHVCKICGKGFAQTSILNVHMKLHTGRPEQCRLCPKKFCRPSELRQHMRCHTGEKPYMCSVCDKSFKQKSHLVEHSATHSNSRPFQCEYCDRTFKQASTLKTHINIHLGKKPFKCPHCPYACGQSYTLKQHLRWHKDNMTETVKASSVPPESDGFLDLDDRNATDYIDNEFD